MHYPEEYSAHSKCSLNVCFFIHNLAEAWWGPEPFPWPLGGGADEQAWPVCPHLSSHCS